MNFLLMSKYFISLLLIFLLAIPASAQESEVVIDSSSFSERYGLRIGSDMGKVIRMLVDGDYTGFEINADYRLTKNIYIAGELGFEDRTTSTDFLNSTANGSYFKGGVDYNMYQNWFGMENMIFAGMRVGAGSFSQTINSYTIYNTDQTFGQVTYEEGTKLSGLTALWTELIIGIKAETLQNLYLGLNVQFKGLITEKESENFENIYIPGFNRTYDSGRFGVGFGYNISYLIPLYKKDN